ncbi:MAG: L-threonylcarbamoyladenylate synthase [Gammaproteobacteria bacterium]
MSQYFAIHPDNPQARLVRQAADIVRGGGVIAYPTDSCYALGCQLGDKRAMERIRRIRKADKDHNFTLVVRDLKELSTYARVDNTTFRLLKSATPGAYTFILRATGEVPKRLMHEKRKTIGLRVPDHPTTQALLAELDEPLMSTTLYVPGDDMPMSDPWEIRQTLEHDVDLVIDGGFCGFEPTTVVDFSDDDLPRVLRHGVGDPAPFE